MIDEQEDVLSYADLVEAEFIKLYKELYVIDAPDKRRADIIDSFWKDIYKAVFRPYPDQVRFNNVKSSLIYYDVKNMEEVCEMFIKLNKRYGGIIKFNQFSNLTGISRYTLYLWHKANKSNGYIVNLSDSDINEEYNNIFVISNTDMGTVIYNGNDNKSIKSNDKLTTLRFDVIKRLQEEMQDSNTNALSNDTMGQVVRANNEAELGKLYEPKRMQQQELIRRALTAEELPKLM